MLLLGRVYILRILGKETDEDDYDEDETAPLADNDSGETALEDASTPAPANPVISAGTPNSETASEATPARRPIDPPSLTPSPPPAPLSRANSETLDSKD